MNRFCIAIGRTISPCKRKPFGCILASCKQILPIIVVSQVLKSVHWLRKFLLCLPFVLMLVCTVSGVRGRFGNRIQCTKRVCTALVFFFFPYIEIPFRRRDWSRPSKSHSCAFWPSSRKIFAHRKKPCS